jgi:Cep192 domain 4/Abnormal spindle-like microcephaly-assoc'd, ASPM-SPD-2-Hydin/PQQ-like domain
MLNPLRSIGVFAVLTLSTFAVSQAVVSLSPTSISFGNQQVGIGSAAQVITLTNTGTTSLSIVNIKISSETGDFSETNTCTSSLAVNASCTVSVILTPTKTGNRSSTVKFTDSASGSPQSVPISGTGVAPVATLSPASISFKGVLVGSTGTAVAITLSNTGTSSLTVTSVMATGDFSQVNNCTATPVAAGASCTITVNFTPTAAWSRGGSIVITDNAYNNPQQVVFLVGMGNSGATAKVSGSSLIFGNQNLGTTSSVKTFTLTNSGTAALNINSIVASGDFSQTNDCPLALSTTAVCTVSVTFSPSYTGKRTGYVTINDTDPSFLQTVTVSGTGTLANALIKIEPGHAAISPIQTQQLAATVTGIPNPNIAWAVDGIAGGNSTVGTISPSGLYTPSTTPAMHIIQATNLDNTQQTAAAFMAVNNYAGTFTGRNDSMRTGQNLNEVALTTGNVNRTQFGKLFTYPVDGYVFAQPLYVARVNIGGASHNVVYVATESDSVYAFDADNNGTGGGLLWQTSFINPANNVTTVPQGEVENGNDIPVQVGITGTPVIDSTAGPNGTLFVVARTKEISNGVTSYVQRLHALDLTTGAEQSGSPVIVQATVSGSGAGSSGGQVAFDPLRENSRPALLLANGTIYICWASLEDILPFHGWVIGYSETTLQQTTAFNTTPNGSDGGIWQGGDGAMADANGNLFVVTSNGTFDASTGGIDYGDTVLRLTAPNGILSVGDYFSPFNQSTLSTLNWDLGGGGAMLLPDQSGPYPHVMFVGGKGSTIYELNRDFLGGFSATANQNLLTLPTALGANLQGSGNRGGPAYWQSQVYYVGSAGYPMQFSMQGGLISTLPIIQSTKSFGYPGAAPVVSANGNINGILWALQTDRYFKSLPASLHAFDASNVSRQLYNSSDNASRDVAGPAVKFTAPTVANGKVYVGTQTEIDVYGLLP